ncbi:MAG: hypothetical protein JXR68_12685 [Bacteroidales bacterium]|nr:hypothetical protein [Bacteroidales bacterium]
MKSLIIFIILTGSVTSIFSQIDFYEHPDTTANYNTDNLYKPLYGGDFSLQLGTFTNISLSPKIAFPIGNNAIIGLGGDFIYTSYFKQQNILYGGNVFGQIFPVKFLILHTEAQMLNLPDYSLINPVRIWDLGLYVGGGLKVMLGTKSYMAYLFLVNLNYSASSPFSNPTFRVSFYF